MPSDHNACAYSWDCTQANSLTTSAAVGSPPPISRWVIRRRRSTSRRVGFVAMWGTLVEVADEARQALLRPQFRLAARLCRFGHGERFSRLDSPGQVPLRREDAPLYASDPDSGT